ncbi:MAG: orotidine-5'-phosphate decarboxylase [Thioalkalivibrionaceae bacterium]
MPNTTGLRDGGGAPCLIIALDGLDRQAIDRLVDELQDVDVAFKVGFEAFVAEGPSLVTALNRRGLRVFLDLKFHDIPKTVGLACRRAVDLGVWMVNVHASGGLAMLEAARAAVPNCQCFDTSGGNVQGGRECVDGTRLIAVTVLTSTDASTLSAVGIESPLAQQVDRLADLALTQAGLDGLVCSGQEAAGLRRRFGSKPLLVTPGIRPAGSAPDDQHRIMTPGEAINAGASQIVVGRPITLAEAPRQVVRSILDEISAVNTAYVTHNPAG